MAKLFANTEDPDQMPHPAIWSGSALFDNYPFTGLPTTMGLGDNLYETLKPIFWEKLGKYFKMFSLNYFPAY